MRESFCIASGSHSPLVIFNASAVNDIKARAAATIHSIRIKENPDWRKNHPLGPVHWDGKCDECGFEVRDRVLGSGMTIQGEGRKLMQLGEYRGGYYTVCSECQPLRFD